MTHDEFQSLMQRARVFGGDYGAGYQRGLRRNYHGDKFGTTDDHEKWLRLGSNGDPREELGRGYRDGFAGKPPAISVARRGW